MGNTIISPCFNPKHEFSFVSSSQVKLIFSEGTTETLNGRNHIAGEIMFKYPDKMVCHADSFFLGQPIPSLTIDDQLLPGNSYFVLPIHCFNSNNILSASSLAALGSRSSPRRAHINFGEEPFEYVKGKNGRLLIKVSPEFIKRLVIKGGEDDCANGSKSPSGDENFLCSTPELKKHYDQLVGSRVNKLWSPSLETISESKVRFSPCKFIGMEWKKNRYEG